MIENARRRLKELGIAMPEATKAVDPPLPRSERELAALIDHTLLRPEATSREIEEAAVEAIRLGCAALCVSPRYLPNARAALLGEQVRLCCVVGFPHGTETAAVKAFAAAQAAAQGADEIDMVLQLGGLRAGEDEDVYKEICFVRSAVPGKVLKVILETGALSDAEKVRGALLAVAAGADYVKTSTGFGPGGATQDDVALLRATVGSAAGVKPAGGVRSLEQALALLRAGANRLGMSATAKLLKAWGGVA